MSRKALSAPLALVALAMAPAATHAAEAAAHGFDLVPIVVLLGRRR